MFSLSRTVLVLTLLFALMLICVPSFASDYYVSATTGSDILGDGSQSAPWATIQYAIVLAFSTASNPADIRVAAGVYQENLLIMKDYINLWGGYDRVTWARDIAANETIIDGGQFDSCVRFVGTLAPLAGGAILGFTIRDGQASHGGGIYCSFASPRILSNIITGNGNVATYGGGIYCISSSPLIMNNVIIGNTASHGGGIACETDSAAIIQYNTISANGNSGFLGGGAGGIFCSGASPAIRYNIISGNLANGGGGIYCWDGSLPTIQNNVISGNSAPGGGGAIYCWTNCSPLIQNNTISLNSAGIGGGILCSTNSSPVMENNAFYNNVDHDVYEQDTTSDPSAHYNEFHGGTLGIWYDEGASSLATIGEVNALAEADFNISVLPEFLPPIVRLSTGISFNPLTYQSTLIDSSASFTPGALAGLLLNPNTNQPLQAPIISNTATTITVWGNITAVAIAGNRYLVFDYHLAPGSPLINAGTTIAGMNGDIDGDARPYPAGGKFDIGADEYTGVLPAEGEGEAPGEPEPEPTEGEGETPSEQEPEPSEPEPEAVEGEDETPAEPEPETVEGEAEPGRELDFEGGEFEFGEGEEFEIFEGEEFGEFEFEEFVEFEFEEFEAPEVEQPPIELLPPSLEVTPTVLTLSADNLSSTFFVRNAGQGTMAWSAESDNPAIEVNPTSGEAPARLGNNVSVTALVIVADFQATVTVTNLSNPDDPPVTVRVNVTGTPRPTVTPPPINVSICAGARVTASTALSTMLDRIREWRDADLLRTRLGEKAAVTYYRFQSQPK